MADDLKPAISASPDDLELLLGKVLKPATQREGAPVGRPPALVRA